MYEIFLPKKSRKLLDKLPEKMLIKIAKAIEVIKKQPFVQNPKIKKLEVPLEGYRFKIPPYRILYTVDKIKKIIYIYDIFHRGRGYKK